MFNLNEGIPYNIDLILNVSVEKGNVVLNRDTGQLTLTGGDILKVVDSKTYYTYKITVEFIVE